MHQRAGAVEYWQSRCHYDNAEQGRLARETAGRFILKIILADRTKRGPAGTEATAAAIRH